MGLIFAIGGLLSCIGSLVVLIYVLKTRGD